LDDIAAAENQLVQNKYTNLSQMADDIPLFYDKSRSLTLETELNRLRLDMQGAQVEDLKKYYQVSLM